MKHKIPQNISGLQLKKKGKSMSLLWKGLQMDWWIIIWSYTNQKKLRASDTILFFLGLQHSDSPVFVGCFGRQQFLLHHPWPSCWPTLFEELSIGFHLDWFFGLHVFDLPLQTSIAKKEENKIQRSKELWEELKSYGSTFSPKLLSLNNYAN